MAVVEYAGDTYTCVLLTCHCYHCNHQHHHHHHHHHHVVIVDLQRVFHAVYRYIYALSLYKISQLYLNCQKTES